MRTIKFRGKIVGNDEWIEGDLLSINNHYEIGWQESSTYETEGGWWQYEVQSETIGQFTGLYDKNGKEIYEGDIMLFHFRKYFAVWDEEEARFVFTNKTNNRLTPYKSTSEECFEIIGNIHDNPELLKGGQE